MLNLTINSQTKSIQCRLELKGEAEPIHVEVVRYQLEKTETETFLVIEEVRVSREWMQVVGNQLICGQKIPLEGPLAAIIPLVM